MRAAHLVPFGVVVLAVAAIGGAAQLDHPAASGKPVAAVTRQVTVTSVARACPPALAGGTGTVALLAHPAGATGATAGQAQLTSLPPAGQPLQPVSPVTTTHPGAPTLLTVPAAASTAKKGPTTATGWSVTATGSMAQAVEAEVAGTSGLATLRCSDPSSDLWFVGPGQQNGAARVQIDLMNIDALPATAAISLITDVGPVQGGNITGITVPPHQTVTESLSPADVSSSVVAIGVHTSVGRVAAAVSAGPAHGNLTSWLPSAATPATQQVIPGVHPSGQAAGLYLVVPGTANAKVSVLAITPQGHYRPFGTQPIELPGESASYVALTTLAGTAAALQITANVPVTASVVMPGSGVGAFTTATGPISEQAIVAGNTSGSGLAASVVLSAPAAAAHVRLTEIDTGSTSDTSTSGTTSASQVVTIQAGHTLLQPVNPPPAAKHGTPFALVITPLTGSGPLYAARVETQNQSTVVSVIPAVSALTTISLPPVSDSYTALSP